MRIFLSAAEPSGDRLAAEIVAALGVQRSDLRLLGVAGPSMRAAGVATVARTEDLSVMGVAEVISQIPRIRRVRQAARRSIDEGLALFVGVDGPEFNLPLARRARAAGIPAVQIASPQVWAWRAGRIPDIAAAVDQLQCLFAFEPALYTGHPQVPADFDARWIGHPAVDRVPPRATVETDCFALLPGSRPQELARHLHPFLAAATQVRQRRPAAHFLLLVPPRLRAELPRLPDWVAPIDDLSGLAHAQAALSKSGTVTLELACMGVPQVVAHRVHPLTYWLGRLLVRGVQHIALPNVLAGREVVPETVQSLVPEHLAEQLLSLPSHQAVPLSELGQGGAAQKAANALLDLLPSPAG